MTYLMKCFVAVVIISFVLTSGCESTKEVKKEVQAKQAADTIGVTHVLGRYHLTDKDFLNEGADQILALGSRVIKLWFIGSQMEPASNMYKYNSDWPEVKTLVEGAKTPYFKAVFDKPFTTYILNIWSIGRHPDYWQVSPITTEQEKNEQQQFYEFTKYLLTTYKNSGKTFILSHHEGDWHLRGGIIDPNLVSSEETIDSMARWLNARQRGVDQAKEEIGQDNVHVYHAAEVNLVVKSLKEGRPNMVNKVLPQTNVDLVSYSSWDSTVGKDGPELLLEALDFIAANVPDSKAFGDKNVFIGEFGLPENEFSPEEALKLTKFTTEAAMKWGCPYVIYWELYCNELKNPNAPVPVTDNNDVRGFWLIRPDGSKSPIWDYYYRMFQQ